MTSDEGTLLDDAAAGQFVDACRATVGDQLRSVTYFTNDGYDQLYLRSDLERDADLAGFADYETLGFGAHDAYRDTELGEYHYTIRIFENGFLVRVTTAEEGVFLTTDGLTLQDFEEVATAVAELLADRDE
ncbi:MAG: hypothetical protein ABEJ31_04210 [Haloarculaceae archaeon]